MLLILSCLVHFLTFILMKFFQVMEFLLIFNYMFK